MASIIAADTVLPSMSTGSYCNIISDVCLVVNYYLDLVKRIWYNILEKYFRKGFTMNKIAVIPKKTKYGIETLVQTIKNHGLQPLLPLDCADCGVDAVYTDNIGLKQADMIIVLGGDGSLLSAARDFFDDGIPLLGINHGNLGFLTELEKNDTEALDDILRGNFVTAKHTILSAKIGGKCFKALNDAAMHRGISARMLNISVYIGTKIINSFRADGVVVSTPTGSTAYSLSAGGPIVDPAVNVLIITPICPHNLYSRSIIVPADKEIILRVSNDDNESTALSLDGQITHHVKNGEDIHISGGGSVSLVRKSTSSFYDRLRKKMY